MSGIHIDTPRTGLQSGPVTTEETQNPVTSGLDKTRPGDISGAELNRGPGGFQRPALIAPTMSVAAMAVALTAIGNKIAAANDTIGQTVIEAARKDIIADGARRATQLETFLAATMTKALINDALQKDMDAYVQSKMPRWLAGNGFLSQVFSEYKSMLVEKYQAEFKHKITSNLNGALNALARGDVHRAATHLWLLQTHVPQAKGLAELLSPMTTTLSVMRTLDLAMKFEGTHYSRHLLNQAAATLTLAGMAFASQTFAAALSTLSDKNPLQAAIMYPAVMSAVMTACAGAVIGLKTELALMAITGKSMHGLASTIAKLSHADCRELDFSIHAHHRHHHHECSIHNPFFRPMFSELTAFMIGTQTLLTSFALSQNRPGGV